MLPGRSPVRRLRRVLGAALLLHYAAAALVIPLAHAAFADDRPLRAAHVESFGDTTCRPVHNHLNCSAFSIARLLAAPAPSVRIPDGDRILAARLTLALAHRPSRAVLGVLGARAPPPA